MLDLGEELLGVGVRVERRGLLDGEQEVVEDHLGQLQRDDRGGLLDEEPGHALVVARQGADAGPEPVGGVLHEGLLGGGDRPLPQAELLHQAEGFGAGGVGAHADQHVLDPLDHAVDRVLPHRGLQTAVLAAVDGASRRAALVEAQAMGPGIGVLGGVLAVAGAVQQIGGLEQVAGQIGDAVVGALPVRGVLGGSDDDAAGHAHHGLQQGVVAGQEPARGALALEGLPHQVALDLGLVRRGDVVPHLGDGVGAARRGAGLEDVAQALDHAEQRGVVLVLDVEGVGHVVHQPLGELAGVGEALVERLDLLLQGLHGLQALLAHGPQGDLEGVAGGIGRDGAQELLELLGGDEGEGPGEEIDAAAARVERGRHEVPQGLVHDAVAGVDGAPGHHARAAVPDAPWARCG